MTYEGLCCALERAVRVVVIIAADRPPMRRLLVKLIEHANGNAAERCKTEHSQRGRSATVFDGGE